MKEKKYPKGKRTKEIYGNCRVHHPNGELMFLCLEKRANWYLNRNLAEKISEDPLTIKLTFEPKGTGNMTDYYLSEKKNGCVVCGSEILEDLTKHHIVPIEYRKHFPVEKKSRSSHDIVVMCTKHHFEYENNFAQKLKKKLEEEAGISRSVVCQDKQKTFKIYSFSKLLMDFDTCTKLPESRIEFFLKEMKRVFGTDDPFEVSSLNLCKKMDEEMDEIGRKIIEKIPDLDDFCKMWRKDFVDAMNPQFMPKGWSIDHKE